MEAAVGPMGGAIFTSVVDGFDYTAVMAVIERTVPEGRRDEVWEKFRWVEPYALNAVAKKRA